MKILDEDGFLVKRGDERFEELYITQQYPFLSVGTLVKGKKNKYMVVERYLNCCDTFCDGGSWEITLQISSW